MNETTMTPGQRMIASAKQALAWVEGEENGSVLHIPHEIDVARIRKKMNLSQRAFAEHYGFGIRTVQEWEQGRTIPSGAARAYLLVIDNEPEAVQRALAHYTTNRSVATPEQGVFTM